MSVGTKLSSSGLLLEIFPVRGAFGRKSATAAVKIPAAYCLVVSECVITSAYSTILFTLIIGNHAGDWMALEPCISKTSAPLKCNSFAIVSPRRPVNILDICRTSSTDDGIGPPVTIIARFLREELLSTRLVSATILSSCGSLCLPCSSRGGIMCTPIFSSLCNEVVSNELCNMPCAVGAITSFDFPLSMRPIATANTVVTVLSAIPLAILLIVL